MKIGETAHRMTLAFTILKPSGSQQAGNREKFDQKHKVLMSNELLPKISSKLTRGPLPGLRLPRLLQCRSSLRCPGAKGLWGFRSVYPLLMNHRTAMTLLKIHSWSVICICCPAQPYIVDKSETFYIEIQWEPRWRFLRSCVLLS